MVWSQNGGPIGGIVPYDYKECDYADEQSPYPSDAYLYVDDGSLFAWKPSNTKRLTTGNPWYMAQAREHWRPCRRYSIMIHVEGKFF